MNQMQSDRPIMEETIPYTIQMVCCPNLTPLSICFVLTITMWVLYIVCCS
jgi:hypothetical protein